MRTGVTDYQDPQLLNPVITYYTMTPKNPFWGLIIIHLFIKSSYLQEVKAFISKIFSQHS